MTEHDELESTRTRLLHAAQELASSERKLSLAERVIALGFGVSTAHVFDLLPLVHVAWADGEVQARERAAILHLLEVRGVERGCAAWVLFEALLEEHPGQAYMDETLAVLCKVVSHNKGRVEALVDLCVRVAQAHGEHDQDPIDPRERQALDEVAAALGPRAQTWIETRFRPESS